MKEHFLNSLIMAFLVGFVAHLAVVVMFDIALYTFKDSAMSWKDFLLSLQHGYLPGALNIFFVVLINMFIFRALIGPIFVALSMTIYAAIVKSLTGNFMLLHEINFKDGMEIFVAFLLLGGYIIFLEYMTALMTDSLATAIKYRTTDDFDEF